MSRFNIGDSVYVAGRHRGKILKLDITVKDDNSQGALVEFDDTNLIPPQMEVPYRALALDPKLPVGQANITTSPTGNQTFDIGQDPWCQGMSPETKIDPKTHCPKCGDEWKETWINKQPFYDCLKCEVRREDVWK